MRSARRAGARVTAPDATRGQPLRVAAPWGLSRYLPLNGFHPLYQPLFDANPRLSFRAIDVPALAAALEHSAWFAGETARRARSLARAWIDAAPDEELLAAFVGHVTAEELWAASDLPGDIEFHHTSPYTAGRRPFVLHCESFLPVFFPFFRQGSGGLEDHAHVRSLYRAILGAPACIGILSHIPETLQEISRFLADPAIDAKLAQTRIGIHEANLQSLLAAPRAAPADGPVFLFTNSAHQSPNSIALRGGIAVLRFAEQYLRAGHRGRFVFRTARPDDALLAAWGVDAGYLRAQEPARIAWLEHYLDEDAQMSLFGAADVLLLPSANLHSATLMQALAAGAIPVVSDTHGTGHYVEDGLTGVVLGGVRERIWATHAPSGIRHDRHEAFPALADSLVAQMFEKLLPLLSQPAALAQMRERMRRTARERFSGHAFRDAFSEDLLRRWHAHAGAARRDTGASLLARFGAVRTSGWPELFTMQPIPRRIDAVPGEQCYAGGAAYYRVRGAPLANLDRWSPFALRRARKLGARGTQIFGTLRDLKEDASRSAASRLARQWRARLDFAGRRLAR